MNKEPIYRINIEVIGQEDEDCTLEESEKVFYCNGFTMILDEPSDKTTTFINNMTRIDIAKGITGNCEMLSASAIARGMYEANKIGREAENPLADLLKALAK